MQLDMHYYGTYALAKTAGLKADICETIAFASQFVDHNAANTQIVFQDGARIDAQATAHHVTDIRANLDDADQRQVWVPFHFLPGNEGTDFSERLICRENSAMARHMVEHHLAYADQTVGVFLMGIAAHVLADTFSHFGFSGVSSRRNKIVNDSLRFEQGLDPELADYIEAKRDAFFRRHGKGGGFFANMKSWLAETVSGALGHGAVATYPDRPYLNWSFEYEYPERIQIQRDNVEHFLAGCEALHDMFTRFSVTNPTYGDGSGVSFDAIKDQIRHILAYQARMEDRVVKWQEQATQGTLGKKTFSIPRCQPETWMKHAADLNSSEDSHQALGSPLYRFYQAASIHRQFILRELLPQNHLVVA